MIKKDHLHIIQKVAVYAYSLVAYCTLMFQPQKNHYQYKPKVFCLRERLLKPQLSTEVQKPKYLIFSRRWSKVSNAF